MIIRRLVAMSNPHARSVMCRREEQRAALTAEQHADFMYLVDQAMQRVDAPDTAEQSPQASSSSKDIPVPENVDPRSRSPDSGNGEDIRHQEVDGVSLRELFFSLRGQQGERQRDTTTPYDAMYIGLDHAQALERMVALPVDPKELLRIGQNKSFDMHLPRSLAEEGEYDAKETTCTDEFLQQCTEDERHAFNYKHSSLAPFGRFDAYPDRSRLAPSAPASRVPNEEVEFFVLNANSEVFDVRFMDPE